MANRDCSRERAFILLTQVGPAHVTFGSDRNNIAHLNNILRNGWHVKSMAPMSCASPNYATSLVILEKEGPFSVLETEETLMDERKPLPLYDPEAALA